MLPQSSRAQLVKNFGEAKAQALEDILTRISQAADDAGIEKKERKNTKEIDSLAAEFTNLVIKAVADNNLSTNTQESEMQTNEDSPFLKELKSKINFDFTTKTKDTQPAPVEDTLIAAFRDASTKASFGLLDGFVQLNQNYANGSKRQ